MRPCAALCAGTPGRPIRTSVKLAQASGIETPTRADLAKLDRKRPKKGSNQDWTHPQDPDARITKMKDGRTHLAHKAEHAVDLETGAIVAVTLQGADQGDTTTIQETVAEAGERITSVVADSDDVSAEGPREVVTDKGYHSRAVVSELTEWGVRTYCSEPNRGRQRWSKQAREQAGGVRKPTSHSWRARSPVIAATRREAGTMESAPVRSWRDAPPAFARPEKYPQTVGCARGCGEPGTVDAQALR